VEEMLFAMVFLTMDQQHVLLNLTSIVLVFVNFDLWMSCNDMDSFALVINFLNDTWVPMHITMGLFEMNETIKQSMATQLWYLLEKFGLLHLMIVFVKDEGSNLSVMVIVLHFINEPLKILKVYEGTCFRHVMSRVCYK
jgi:hypothetical protein